MKSVFGFLMVVLKLMLNNMGKIRKFKGLEALKGGAIRP